MHEPRRDERSDHPNTEEDRLLFESAFDRATEEATRLIRILEVSEE